MPAIFEKLDKIRPVYDAVDKLVMALCKLLLIADILITTYQTACHARQSSKDKIETSADYSAFGSLARLAAICSSVGITSVIVLSLNCS